MKKRVLSLLLALAMLLCLIPAQAAAAEPETVTFGDLGKHRWAAQSILRWAEAGIVNGRSEGVFAPGEAITRGEFAKILSEILGLTEEAEEGFADLNTAKWYAKYILRCKEAGIMKGNSDGTVNAESNIKRQEAFAMLARTLQMEKGTAEDLAEYQDNDAGQISRWAIPEVAAVINYKAVQGDTQGNLNPKADITRAEVCVILDRIIGVYIDEEGEVSATSEKQKKMTGNFVVINQKFTDEATFVPAEDGAVSVIVGQTEVLLAPTNGYSPLLVVANEIMELIPEEEEYVYLPIRQETIINDNGVTSKTEVLCEFDPETRVLTLEQYENGEHTVTGTQTYNEQYQVIHMDLGNGVTVENIYENGYRTQSIYHGTNNEQVITMQYDEEGRLIYQQQVNTDSNGTVTASWEHKLTYDENGDMILHESYMNGELVAYVEVSYDGAVTTEKNYSPEGELSTISQTVYDEQTGEETYSVYEPDGTLISVQHIRCDEYGNVVYQTYEANMADGYHYSYEITIEYQAIPLN